VNSQCTFDFELETLFRQSIDEYPRYWRIDADELHALGLASPGGAARLGEIIERADEAALRTSTPDRSALVYVDLGTSPLLRTFSESVVKQITDEPNDIYIYAVPSNTPIFDIEGEFYCVDVMLESMVACQATFRSFRDRRSIQNGWEFSNGLYVRGLIKR
jgi:hypothetical protein